MNLNILIVCMFTLQMYEKCKIHSGSPILTLSWWAPPRKCWDIVSLKNQTHFAISLTHFTIQKQKLIQCITKLLRHIFFEYRYATLHGLQIHRKKRLVTFRPQPGCHLANSLRDGNVANLFYSVSTNTEQYVLILKIIDQPEAPCWLPCWNLQVVKAGGGGDVAESVPHQLVPAHTGQGGWNFNFYSNQPFFQEISLQKEWPGYVEF